MALTDIKCKNAKAKEKSYKLFDSGGLYLEIMPSGKKHWRIKYYYLKKEKRISLGAYPLISLAKAREERDNSKRLLLENIDPSAARKRNIAEIKRNTDNTFKAVATEWLETKRHEWSEAYEKKNVRILNLDLLPHLGDRPIKEIEPPELLEVLKKIEKRGAHDIAKKARQLSGMIFTYGIQTGKCKWNAAQNLKGALKGKKTQHMAALSEKVLPDFLRALERNEARLYEQTRRAIWFSLYTFQRPGEIRQAQFSEISWDDREWHIKAEKMKMRRPHIVPLSDQALQILEQQRDDTSHLNTDWVFPSQSGHKKPMSDGTVNKAIKSMGFGDETTAHGFRALARTLIRERLKIDSEIIEKQLAHKTSNPLGEAYDRTQFLDERVDMMSAWATYLGEMANSRKVIVGKFGAAK